MKHRIETHCGGYLYRGNLYQTDYEFPGLAHELGWSTRRVQRRNGRNVAGARVMHGCMHYGTDGTVNCPNCGVTAGAFIAAATAFLDSKC